jgi:hypothetical protein
MAGGRERRKERGKGRRRQKRGVCASEKKVCAY